MRATWLSFVAALSAAWFGAIPSAAKAGSGWDAPSNVRIVQKSDTGSSGRVFQDIQSAIDSLTTCTAAAPCIVKVMPGVYDLGTASLQMKSYVDLEGSGQGNTIVTSSNNNVDGITCTSATVLMANNSAIRNIQIENRAPALNGAGNAVVALAFNGVAGKAEGVTIVTGSDIALGGRNMGVCSSGAWADANLNTVEIVVRNGGAYESIAIYEAGGRLTVTNSRLTSSTGPGGFCDVIDDDNVTGTPASVTVTRSVLTASCPRGFAFLSASADTTFSNSTLTVNPAGGLLVSLFAYGNLAVVNTRILDPSGTSVYWVDPTLTKIASSQLSGDLSGLIGVRLTNDYDPSFNPIPNQ